MFCTTNQQPQATSDLVRSYKMTIDIIEIENIDGATTEHVIIDRGNGEFTSMPKAIYDAQQAELADE
jgi:hypothetical protein